MFAQINSLDYEDIACSHYKRRLLSVAFGCLVSFTEKNAVFSAPFQNQRNVIVSDRFNRRAQLMHLKRFASHVYWQKRRYIVQRVLYLTGSSFRRLKLLRKGLQGILFQYMKIRENSKIFERNYRIYIIEKKRREKYLKSFFSLLMSKVSRKKQRMRKRLELIRPAFDQLLRYRRPSISKYIYIDLSYKHHKAKLFLDRLLENARKRLKIEKLLELCDEHKLEYLQKSVFRKLENSAKTRKELALVHQTRLLSSNQGRRRVLIMLRSNCVEKTFRCGRAHHFSEFHRRRCLRVAFHGLHKFLSQAKRVQLRQTTSANHHRKVGRFYQLLWCLQRWSRFPMHHNKEEIGIAHIKRRRLSTAVTKWKRSFSRCYTLQENALRVAAFHAYHVHTKASFDQLREKVKLRKASVINSIRAVWMWKLWRTAKAIKRWRNFAVTKASQRKQLLVARSNFHLHEKKEACRRLLTGILLVDQSLGKQSKRRKLFLAKKYADLWRRNAKHRSNMRRRKLILLGELQSHPKEEAKAKGYTTGLDSDRLKALALDVREWELRPAARAVPRTLQSNDCKSFPSQSARQYVELSKQAPRPLPDFHPMRTPSQRAVFPRNQSKTPIRADAETVLASLHYKGAKAPLTAEKKIILKEVARFLEEMKLWS